MQAAQHMLEGELELRFDGFDGTGFGSATDPNTNDQYILNRSTIGPNDDFDWCALTIGQHFKAKVTRAQYVVEITEVMPLQG